jgi:hypothetical protein
MFTQGRRSIVLAAAIGLLVGGILASVTPAGASLAVNWDRVWKQQIKPRADMRYHTKAKANAKFAPYPKLVRGVLSVQASPGGASKSVGGGYSFGVTFASAPTAHIIVPGGLVPAGCSGTLETPNAKPGHLCIFQGIRNNVGSETVCSGDNVCGQGSRFGFFYLAFASTSDTVDVSGTWAARPPLAGIAGSGEFAPRVARNSGGHGTVSGR